MDEWYRMVQTIVEDIDRHIRKRDDEALTLSDRAYIMESGNITLEGRSSELIDDPRVKDAYLGGDL